MTTTDNSGKISGEMGGYKGRGPLPQIVEELKRQVDARRDFVIDTRDLSIFPGVDGQPTLVARNDNARDFIPREGYAIKDQAFAQLGHRLIPDGGVPTRFLRRAWEFNSEHLSDYLSDLLHSPEKDTGNRRLVRVLDDNVRAFLSQSYKAIDSLDIATCAMQAVIDHDAMPIEASLTDSHMRLRFVSRQITEELDRVRQDETKSWFAGGLGSDLSKVAAQSWGELPGDTAHPALGFRNSETGHGGCDVDGGMLLGVCFNLAWVRRMVHEIHIGEKLDEGIFTAETYTKHAELVYSKVRDATHSYFSKESFAKIISDMNDANSNVVRAPSVACNVAIKESSVTEAELDALLGHFVQQPGGMTEYNLGQAVARLAQDTSDLDRAEQMEWDAGKICSGSLSSKIEAATLVAEAALV